MNIFYRLCEERKATHSQNENHRPNWFSKKNCLKSFINSVQESNTENEVVFVFDGEPGQLFESIPKNYRIERINAGNYRDSLLKTYMLAYECNNSSDYYFVEDDYLHLPNSIESIFHAVKKFGLISGYDHLSRYDPIRYSGNRDTHYDLKFTFDDRSNHHWRTNESVCHTYAVSKEIFKSKFHIITRSDCVQHDQNLFRALYAEGIPLWTAVPGLITQVDPYMSPGINWEEFNRTL